jgi:O-antigen ligase
MFLLYVIVTRACSQEGVPSSILTGIAVGLCFQALMTVWQRWGGGALQAGGTFGHQNFLGFVTHFALFPLFALLLAGVRGWQTIAATLAGLVVAALTTSRATVGLVAIGLVVLFVASSARSWTARKQIVLLAALIILPIMSIFVLSSFQKRFTYSADSTELSEREAFQLAASMMLSDHPMGIGANNYVVVANLGGYMENAGVAGRSASRATLVHNAYWVAAVETGYLGLIALALLMFRTTTSAFRASWQNRSDVRGDLLLGLGVSLLIVSIHNMFEWMFFMPASQYLFAMTTGLIAGLSGQLAHRSNGTVKLALRSVQTRPPRQHSI